MCFGCLFSLDLLSWHCWEWLNLCWLRSLKFLWRGCHIRGLQGYRSLARPWAVDRMALCSSRVSCGFCRGFSRLLSSLYRIAHPLVLLFLLWTMSGSCHWEVALHVLWLSPLSPMARGPWRWVRVRCQNILWAGKVLTPLLGSFSSSVEKENNWPLMLWLSWLSSLQFWLPFLIVHCFGGSPGASYMLSPRWSQKVQNSAELKGG